MRPYPAPFSRDSVPTEMNRWAFDGYKKKQKQTKLTDLYQDEPKSHEARSPLRNKAPLSMLSPNIKKNGGKKEKAYISASDVGGRNRLPSNLCRTEQA